MVGAPEHELTERRIPYETGVARYREIARGQILGDDSGLFKMLFLRDTGQLLGVHAIGTGATELIHIGQAVLGLGGGLDYFLQTVFNYPTLAECYRADQRRQQVFAVAVQAGSQNVRGTTMPSPFPGIDPYLEHAALWPGVHKRFIRPGPMHDG